MRIPERHSFSLPAGGFFSACREHVSAGEDAADGAFDHVDAVNGYAALALIAAVRRRHGHDDDGVISPTSSMLGRAGVPDRVDRAKGMTVWKSV